MRKRNLIKLVIGTKTLFDLILSNLNQLENNIS
jgi:hypothetical protein